MRPLKKYFSLKIYVFDQKIESRLSTADKKWHLFRHFLLGNFVISIFLDSNLILTSRSTFLSIYPRPIFPSVVSLSYPARLCHILILFWFGSYAYSTCTDGYYTTSNRIFRFADTRYKPFFKTILITKTKDVRFLDFF